MSTYLDKFDHTLSVVVAPQVNLFTAVDRIKDDKSRPFSWCDRLVLSSLKAYARKIRRTFQTCGWDKASNNSKWRTPGDKWFCWRSVGQMRMQYALLVYAQICWKAILGTDFLSDAECVIDIPRRSVSFNPDMPTLGLVDKESPDSYLRRLKKRCGPIVWNGSSSIAVSVSVWTRINFASKCSDCGF